MRHPYCVEEPVTGEDGSETSRFTIYQNGEELAVINPGLPREQQQMLAHIFLGGLFLFEHPGNGPH